MPRPIPLLLHLLLHILTFLITASPTSPQAPASPITPTKTPKDPCGPAIQPPNDPTIPNSTCNIPIPLSSTASTYGATLLNDGSGLSINYQNCYPYILDACTALLAPSTPLGVWNWTTPGSQCVLGFFLEPYAGTAPLPTYDQCLNNVFGAMVKVGRYQGGTAFNQVAVNLRRVPDQDQMGEAVNVGYPSYVVSYLPLVHDDTLTPLG